MKSTLVLYSQGNKSQFKDFPNKDNCIFVNTKYSDLKGITQGMRFMTLCLNDLNVSKEAEEYAKTLIVTKEFFKMYDKVMSIEITDADRCLVSLTTKATEN